MESLIQLRGSFTGHCPYTGPGFERARHEAVPQRPSPNEPVKGRAEWALWVPAASRVRVCLAFWTGAGGERASRWSPASEPCPRAGTSGLVVSPMSRLCSWTATGPYGVAARRSSEGESSSRFLLWRLRSDCSSPASPRSGWARCSCFCRPRGCVRAAIARRCRPFAGRWRPAAAGFSRSHAAAPTSVRTRSVRRRALPPVRAATAPSGSGGSRPTAPPPSAVQPLPGHPAGGQRRRSSRCA